MKEAYNVDIRQAAATKGVCLWQIADELGLAGCDFTGMLRRELPDAVKVAIHAIIGRLQSFDSG